MKWVLRTFLLAAAGLWGSSALAQGTSTFNGVIFRDLNGDGIQDGDEEGIPGVLVELRGGANSDDLHAAVITGPDGSYSVSALNLPDAANYRLRYFYPNIAFDISTTGVSWFAGGDPRPYARTGLFPVVGGEPIGSTIDLGLEPVHETLSHSGQLDLAATNWGVSPNPPKIITLPKSPNGYGVLKEVRLYFNYHVLNPSVTVKNVDGSSATTGRFQTTARFGVTTPFDSESYNHESNYNSPDITPLLPGEEVSFSNLHSATGGISHIYDAGDIGNFVGDVGDENFPVPFSSTGFSGFNGSGNFEASVSTVSAPGVFVIYIYEEGSLPVKLANFSAHTEGNIGILTWSTSEETNSFAFEVERSANGKKWATVGTVAAKGESNRLVNYTFPDAGLSKGINYYRLKMIDRDGSFNHSHIISLRSSFGKEVRAVTYPNPTSEAVFLQNIDASEIQSIDVISTTGRTLLNINVYDSAKGIDVRSLPNGLYLVRYTLASGEQEALKVIVRR